MTRFSGGANWQSLVEWFAQQIPSPTSEPDVSTSPAAPLDGSAAASEAATQTQAGRAQGTWQQPQVCGPVTLRQSPQREPAPDGLHGKPEHMIPHGKPAGRKQVANVDRREKHRGSVASTEPASQTCPFGSAASPQPQAIQVVAQRLAASFSLNLVSAAPPEELEEAALQPHGDLAVGLAPAMNGQAPFIQHDYIHADLTTPGRPSAPHGNSPSDSVALHIHPHSGVAEGRALEANQAAQEESESRFVQRLGHDPVETGTLKLSQSGQAQPGIHNVPLEAGHGGRRMEAAAQQAAHRVESPLAAPSAQNDNRITENAATITRRPDTAKSHAEQFHAQPGAAVSATAQVVAHAPSAPQFSTHVQMPETRTPSGLRDISQAVVANRDAFTALDASPGAPGASWIHAGAHHAEAGYLDPALGWVGVRAQSAGAALHAAIVPNSPEAAQALSTHLAGLNSYLAEHHDQPASITMATLESSSSSASAFDQAGQGSAHQQHQPAGHRETATPTHSAAQRGMPASLTTEPMATNPASLRGGAHISVIA